MRALITGINGQDGSYLSELLLSKNYEVFGLIRRSSTENLGRISHILKDLKLIHGDLQDEQSIQKAVSESKPDEIYNLGAMTFVPASWNHPELTFDINCLGLLRLIHASEKLNSRIYQASSSEMYGNSYPHFEPISPYGVSKLSAHHLANAYRLKGRFISCGICFNHESPRRGNEFVTKKITNFFKKPKGVLRLGSLMSARDWGFAGDYVEAMKRILEQPKPDDYEIATGESHTVWEFLDLACPDWREYVIQDPELIRPNEVNSLKGNPKKINGIGWKPRHSFKDLVRMMMHDE